MRFAQGMLLAGSAILSQCALGACVTFPPTDIHDRVAFASAVVRSLKDFQDAHAMLSSIGRGKSAIDMLSSVDTANEKLQCASDDISGFSADGEQATHTAVMTLQSTAAGLIKVNAKTKELIVAELNGELSQEKRGDHAIRMANLATFYRNAWEMLPLTATMSVLALEESVAPTSQKLRLAMTEAQRDSLNRELLQAFPALKGRGSDRGLSQAEAAAAVLYGGLNKKGWSFRDEPGPSRTRSEH